MQENIPGWLNERIAYLKQEKQKAESTIKQRRRERAQKDKKIAA
ncbi:MAG: hypothetical protein ACLFN5_01850 [bacterium]